MQLRLAMSCSLCPRNLPGSIQPKAFLCCKEPFLPAHTSSRVVRIRHSVLCRVAPYLHQPLTALFRFRSCARKSGQGVLRSVVMTRKVTQMYLRSTRYEDSKCQLRCRGLPTASQTQGRNGYEVLRPTAFDSFK